jgi:FMN-dependent NADH-azoreductase
MARGRAAQEGIINVARVLWVSSSPRRHHSKSTEIATVLVDGYKTKNPSDSIEHLDLWAHKLPELDQVALEAKYAVLRRASHSEAEALAWRQITEEADAFKAFDKYIFSIPMWNWSIPFILKKYIDTITQPGLLFNWTPATGYVGLLNKPVVAIYTSSFDYGADSGISQLDHQKQYFEAWLRIIGCADIRSIVVAPTSAAFASSAAAQRAAVEAAQQTALEF